jgi:AAA domain, putative AbiEii toxin, Type IV TA system
MFLRKLQLKNFKRFTDLTIDLSGVQPPPKLVLMIGANGSGKSCVFDAFEWLSHNSGQDNSAVYYKKAPDKDLEGQIEFAEGQPLTRNDRLIERADARPGLFYGRSALRQLPRLSRLRMNPGFDPTTDSDRPRFYIDFDQRFENDIDAILSKLLMDVFGEDVRTRDLRERYLAPFNEALERVFQLPAPVTLKLSKLIPPGENKVADILFTKGQSSIHYDLLSSGEKEVINILFNLFVRHPFYRDTIYIIDELDVHLNTALQYELLREVTENWIPDGCQLWVASHSLGFIQYARESEHAVILDFDLLDFDVPQTLMPQPRETTEVYEIAVPAEILPNLFKDKQLVLCENKNDRLYQLLELPGKVFYGVTDKNEVYYRVKNNPTLRGVIDRDYMTEKEIAGIRLRFPGLFVLGYYAIENYLYHPENLREVIPGFDVEMYRAEITRQKNAIFKEVLLGLKQARSYKVLRDEKLEDPSGAQAIAAFLESDDFDVFYAYFDMKGKFNRQAMARLNLPESQMARTRWFRATVGNVFNQQEDDS